LEQPKIDKDILVKWNSDHVSVLKSRKEVIDLLPNVKPRKAKWLLGEIKGHFLIEYYHADGQNHAEYTPFTFNDLTITEPEFNSMMVSADNDWGDEIDYITPEGAALIVKMYHAGCFELNGKPGCTEELEKYAASGEELLAAYNEQTEFEAYEKAKEDHWKEHPEELPENMFTASRLNAIMWHHGVKGRHVTMDIGGITVTKSVTSYTSNSGKSSSNTVVLSWTGSDGVSREEFLTKSAYENNRRNDADRNWGLPE